MQNVVPSHLSDTQLFDFKGLTQGSPVVGGGDIAFDRETFPLQPAGWQDLLEDDTPSVPDGRLDIVELR